MNFRDKGIGAMMKNKLLIYALAVTAVCLFSFFVFFDGCAPKKGEVFKTAQIGDNEFEPAKWGEVFPLQYESWLKTKEPRPKDKSFYKRGWDTDKIVWDKLSEYPFMALLFNGWGFGIEYNEPRGHYYMMIDQREIDQSRTKAGGVCLTCKSPYIGKMVREYGRDLFKMPYADAVNKIPAEHRDLGAACIDCHDNKSMDPRVTRWTINEGLKAIKKEKPTRQEMRSIVCAQCHVTYCIPKDEKMQSTGVFFPWQGSSWGNISIENIIKVLLSSPSHREWKQTVTGFKLAYIRHPEFEFYTNQSPHFKAGISCADCHMPYKRVGSFKISDHNLMSPLKDELRACANCHPQSTERLLSRVKTIQDRTMSLLIRSGYASATVAKLFELTHAEQAKGRQINGALYEKAKSFYEEALYRVIFIGAENSIGFHNPDEAGRILGDAVAYASKSEAFLRQALSQAGVQVPESINLELSRYLNGRGAHKLNFRPSQEFKDPYGTQDRLLPRSARGI